MQKNLDKQFKKKVIGVAQDALILGPDGLGDVFLEEVEQACERLCLPYKSRGELKLNKAQIELLSWDFRSLLELCQTLRTCREFWWKIDSAHVGSLKEFKTFLTKVDWELFLPKDAVIYTKVDSLQSKLYHEGLLKEEIENKLQSLKYELTQHELNSTFKLFVSQEKNRTNIYLSLNGESLYKRNYKKSFYAKAPIKEHLGAALFNLIKPKDSLSNNDLIYIPFAGSGTLGFEAILNLYNLRPMLWRDEFSMKEMTGYPQASQKYLQKAADKELLIAEANFAKVEFLDSDEKTIEELEKNIQSFSSVSKKLRFDALKGDFFTYTPKDIEARNIVVGLNPPYGIRLNAGENKTEFYKNIAEKLNELSSQAKSLSGFCLLPDEKSSFVFMEALSNFETKLRHLTQGGKHIRIAVFESK